MDELKTFQTERLLLRPFTLQDAPAVAQAAGRREIADTTILIPHPYTEIHARRWIEGLVEAAAHNRVAVFAIQAKSSGKLVGAIGLREIDEEHSQAELGFWIAVEFWGQGFATEAARAVIRHAFESLHLNRVYAHHMARNPASGRVLEKVGLKREGFLRQRVRKWGRFEDVVLLAILREEWASANSLLEQF